MVRSHAIAFIPDTHPAVNNNKLNDGYETDIDQEMTNVEDDNKEDDNKEDDNKEEDNKIRKKGNKPKVWDLQGKNGRMISYDKL